MEKLVRSKICFNSELFALTESKKKKHEAIEKTAKHQIQLNIRVNKIKNFRI